MPNASETAIKFIGLRIYFANECWLRPRIKISAFLFAALIFFVSFFYQEKKESRVYL
jgi:hypothetical protein